MMKIIYCPSCSHRLFDVEPHTHGIVEIKCPRCKKVQQIRMEELQKNIKETT